MVRFFPRFSVCVVPFGFFLISSSVFASDVPLGANPDNYTWVMGKSGAYRLFDPTGSIRAQYAPGPSVSDISWSTEGSLPAVRETLGSIPDFNIYDSQTGEVIGRILPSVSRDLTFSDIADAAGDVVSLTPAGRLAVLAATGLTVLASVLEPAAALMQSSPSSLPPLSSCASHLLSEFRSEQANPSCWTDSFAGYDSSGGIFVHLVCHTSSCSSVCNIAGFSSSTVSFGDSSGCSASSSSSQSKPSTKDVMDWAKTHPNAAIKAIEDAMLKNPDLAPEIAQELAPFNPQLPDPIPFDYDVSPNPDVVKGPERTVSSETREIPAPVDDPSAKPETETITKTRQPVDFITGGPGGLTEKDTVVTRTTTCVDGSCNTSSTTEYISSSQLSRTLQDRSPFIPPPYSFPPVPSVPFSKVPLKLSVPSSVGVCPPPYSFSVFGRSFSLSYAPFCRVAVMARPYVQALGGVGAALLILR